jgi:ATPase subunit of ABC transporter with duplicated ATPase domains
VLSGGERRRVELARILFAGSDTLLLDEPTNHLDIDAKTWLLGFLREYRGALLVISHDLELLDEAITRVLHLDRRTPSIYHLVQPTKHVEPRKHRCKKKKWRACKA